MDAEVNDKSFELGALELARKLNSFNLNSEYKKNYFEFNVDNKLVGHVFKDDVEILKGYGNVFIVEDKTIYLNPDLKSFDAKTEAVEKALIDMRDKRLFKDLDGWRNEHYFVRTNFSESPLLSIERASVSIFGLKSYGCHVNGYTKKNKEYFIWVAKRSLTKSRYPGKLDNFTGGGLTAGLKVAECVLKELEEEAGVTLDEAKFKLRSTNAISYAFVNENGQLSKEAGFIFDLKLPNEFIPRNKDGEVESFCLMNIEQIKKAILSDEFKPNSAAITLDFLFRKGILTADECNS